MAEPACAPGKAKESQLTGAGPSESSKSGQINSWIENKERGLSVE